MSREKVFSNGEIINISQGDCQAFYDLATFGAGLFVIPIETVIGLSILYWLFGSALLYSTLFLVLYALVNKKIQTLQHYYKSGLRQVVDKRSKLVTDVFNNIRFIKINGLEDEYLARLLLIKEEELRWVGYNFYRAMASIFVNNAFPQFFIATVFGIYLYQGGQLSLEIAFAAQFIFKVFALNFKDISYLI